MSELLVGEHWLLESGLVTQTAADTLLGYAYMQPGVRNVTLSVDYNEPEPTVTYKVALQPWFAFKQQIVRSLIAKNSFFGKVFALVLMKLGAPSPDSTKDSIESLAKGFLPKSFKVQVDVE